MRTRPTEHETTPARQALAYGYVRMAEPDETEISRLRLDLGKYCQRQGYRLVTVFCDRDVRATALARPALAGLVDAASAANGEQVVVIVPRHEHLSTDDQLRASLERSIRLTGATLIVTDGINGHASGRRVC